MTERPHYLEPLIDPYSLHRPVDWDDQFSDLSRLEVEIGFGLGEILIQNAIEQPQTGYIGIEQNWKRIYRTLKTLGGMSRIDNIRLMHVDARVAFERIFSPKSIDRIYCLFPCPWPKKDHIKHRLFDRSFFKLTNSRLKDRGELQVVTDYFPFHEWILGQVSRSGFDVETGTTQGQFNTKFEKKWKDEGQSRFFEIKFFKKQHKAAPVNKDVSLKTYTLKDFQFKNLKLKDEKGKTSVIFKEILYDHDRNKAMIHSVVAEGHLTQHFWVSVFKTKGAWRVCKADGQNFFPTSGIARALQLVYEAVYDAH